MKNANPLSFDKIDNEEKLAALQSISEATISLVGIHGRLLFRPSDWMFVIGKNNIAYDAEKDILSMTINIYQENMLLEIEQPQGFVIYAGTSLEIKKAGKIMIDGKLEENDNKKSNQALLLE